MNRKEVHNKVRELLQSRRGKLVTKCLRWIFMAGILCLLSLQFTRIGWEDIWRALPTNPLFYLIFIFMYASLPLTETFIYRKIWDFPFLQGLPTFLKKRVYNKDVLNYSGEVFLLLSADRIGITRSRKEMLHAIKDNNILSGLASTIFAVGLLGFFIISGQVIIPENIQENFGIKAVAIVVLVVVLIILGLRFRRSIFSMPGRMLAMIFSIHITRMICVNTLQVLQWAIILDEVSLTVLFTFLAMQIVTGRLLILPARDLIFIGISVEMTGFLNVSSVDVAGMLLVIAFLDKGLNLVLYIVTSFLERHRRQTITSKEETDRIVEMPVIPAGEEQNDLSNTY